MEKEIAGIASRILEISGIALILLIGAYATFATVYRLLKNQNKDDVYKNFRNQFGRGILLGLEFMVGADIIQTVAVDINYESIILLAGIVLIRTFLSFTLELEISGRWPWQKE